MYLYTNIDSKKIHKLYCLRFDEYTRLHTVKIL